MSQITNSLELQQHLAELLRGAGHPEIVDVAAPNNRQTIVIRGLRPNAPGAPTTVQHQAPGSNAACSGVGEPGVEITPATAEDE